MKLSPTIIVVHYISPLESDHLKLYIKFPIRYLKFKETFDKNNLI